ncbi:MAG: glycosyltransferase family 39 protein [Blastocatellia bacterium]|nr:glycosyltransferase family 39 protein [Blastocatellia bacterium]MCS7157327.1 glycosyltransferase family 39 protein [Blastocatellia bacterium]MDW8168231.1 glycosyltransferase family 39 protein [Acidobacteriota bacterium]MDW8255475.1 glycosyltransferase family 39 protein [Acidobacteriota bacterium]
MLSSYSLPTNVRLRSSRATLRRPSSKSRSRLRPFRSERSHASETGLELFHVTIPLVLGQEAQVHERATSSGGLGALGSARLWRAGLWLALVLLPYGIHVGTPSLWDANEAFYVEGPREMREAGDWLTPRFNFAEKLNKPILSYWLVLLSFELFGASEAAERVVILLCVFATVVLTYRLGEFLLGHSSALWGALVLATSPKLIMVARRSLIDALLMLLITATLYFLISGWHRGSRGRLLLGYVAMGLGVLAKGLLGIVLPAGTIALFLLLTRRLEAMKRFHPVSGVLVVSAIAAPWFALMTWRYGTEYLLSFFIGEHVSRYLHGMYGARRPFWYYVPMLLGEFAPWSFFLPLAIGIAWKCIRSPGQEKERPRPFRISDKLSLLLIWFGFGFVFFSLSAAKQNEYLLPLYPAAALLVAHMFQAIESRDAARSAARRGFLLTLAILSVMLLLGARWLWHAARALFPDQPLAYLPPLALGATALGVVWQGWRWRPRRVLGLLVAAIALLHAAIAGLLPEIERYRPVRPLAERIRREARADDLVGYYRYTAPSLCYYTRRKIFEVFSPEELRDLWRSEKRVFCVMSEREARELSERQGFSLRVLECRPSLFPMRMREFLRLRRPEDLERVCVVTNR